MRARYLLGLVCVPVCLGLLLATVPASAVTPVVKVKCTIIGTPGDDVLVGTPGDDVICGRGGNDTISGRGGDDVIRGGPGRDVISGGPGRDVISGGPGDDSVDEGAFPPKLIVLIRTNFPDANLDEYLSLGSTQDPWKLVCSGFGGFPIEGSKALYFDSFTFVSDKDCTLPNGSSGEFAIQIYPFGFPPGYAALGRVTVEGKVVTVTCFPDPSRPNDKQIRCAGQATIGEPDPYDPNRNVRATMRLSFSQP
ncbi:MAG: hypothetical protein PSX37_03365 [bacterium]|nr:hypothetical protein [bacterium]